tara:strand:+ start:108 stop:755 length:648 start_codon:yes stop_codon:yes gene_type:complete
MKSELLKRILSSILLISLIIYLIIEGSYLFTLFLTICFFLSLYEWQRMSKNIIYKYLGIIFLFISFYSVYQIRFSFANEYYPLFFILIICVSTDIGGFLFGKILKGPKLTKISPNKTYAGVMGSYILSLLSIFIYFKYINNSNFNGFTGVSFFFVIIFSTVSQIGDLIISYFKRQSDIKNTGNIIPGHGGLLDRIDGMIFAFPLYYLLILFGYFL